MLVNSFVTQSNLYSNEALFHLIHGLVTLDDHAWRRVCWSFEAKVHSVSNPVQFYCFPARDGFSHPRYLQICSDFSLFTFWSFRVQSLCFSNFCKYQTLIIFCSLFAYNSPGSKVFEAFWSVMPFSVSVSIDQCFQLQYLPFMQMSSLDFGFTW